jgi:signal transduction histidine kinase
MVEKTAIQNGGVIVTDFGDHPPARANQSRLSQVFVNLLVNAAQSLDPDDEISRIDVTTSTDQAGRVTVTVADTGIGIPQELLDRIFDPFFTTKPVGEGTGIGLAICHQIIEAVGGTIEIDSEVGEGTTVRVTLPAAEG